MKKLFVIFVAALFSLTAFAQTYPSPTFNSVTLQNPLTAVNGGTGATTSTGSGSVVLGTSPTIAAPIITGSFAATGLVTLADHAPQAANTIIANATGSTASPAAIAAPSCSTPSSALSWMSGSGLICNTAINAATLGGATFAAPGPIGSTPSTAAFTTLSSTAAPTVGAATVYPTVPTNAALKALSTATVSSVTRLGFAVSGDASPLTYLASGSACSLNSGAGDNGSQVQSANSKCWIAQFPAAVVDVLQFGAKGDMSVDSTAAINAAVAAVGALANGGTVYFPPSVSGYKVSGSINLSGNSVTLAGGNAFSTLIQSASTTTSIINNTGIFNRIQNLSFIYTTVPTVAVATIFSSGSNFTGTAFVVRNGYTDLEVTNASANMFSQVFLFDYVTYGFYVHDHVGDAYLSQFIMNTSSTSGTGIRAFNQVEALNVTDGDILEGSFGMTADATSNAIGARPAYSSFQGVYFDSGSQGAVFLNNSVEFDFTNCWFSAGRSGSGNPGLSISNTVEMHFTNSKFFNNGGPGALVAPSSTRTTFISNDFESNSVTAGPGVAHGLVFSSGTTDFVAQGNVAHNGLFPGVQGWGILVNSGASDRYIIENNLVSGNSTGGVSDGGSGVNKNVAHNY